MDVIFWNTYLNIRFKCYYYEHFKLINSKWNVVCTAIPLIISTGGLASFLANNNLYQLSVILIILGQAMSVINHLLPFSKRDQALSYLIPEIELLLAKIDHEWSHVRSNLLIYSDQEINDLILHYENEYLTIEHKALSNISIPRNDKCKNIAFKEAEEYLTVRFKSSHNSESDPNTTEPKEKSKQNHSSFTSLRVFLVEKFIKCDTTDNSEDHKEKTNFDC